MDIEREFKKRILFDRNLLDKDKSSLTKSEKQEIDRVEKIWKDYGDDLEEALAGFIDGEEDIYSHEFSDKEFEEAINGNSESIYGFKIN